MTAPPSKPSQPPLYPGKAPTGASLILDYLRLEGVDTIFGVPGGGLIALLVELRKRGREIRFVVGRQETGSLFAADGYARARNHLAAAMVTSGPGALNAVNGFVNANDSHVPVILLSGELSEALTGHGYIQEGLGADLDIPALYRATTAYTALCTDLENLQIQLEHALRLAATPPYGAVQVTIPNDVAVLPLSSSVLRPMPKSPRSYRPVPASAAPEPEAQAILKNLLSATKPLIFLGNGCRRALLHASRGRSGPGVTPRLRGLMALCHRLAIPVMTTADAKGIFPETHPLSLRFYGKASCTWPAAYMGTPQYDALLTLGASLHDLDTERWSPAMVPAGPFMQVDLDASIIGRGFPITLGVVADVAPVIDRLCHLGEEVKLTKRQQVAIERRRALVARIRATSPYRYGEAMSSEASPAKPQAIMQAITELAPEGCHVLADPGNSLAWAAHYLTVDPPGYRAGKKAVIRGQSHQALGMGPMGWATAAVVGCKVGAPDQACIAIAGDGAFLMHGNEVATAAAHGVGAIWVVLDNHDLSMVSQGMFLVARAAGGANPEGWEDYYDLGTPDLAAFAESLGAQAVTVSSPEEFRKAFTAALSQADGPPRKSSAARTRFTLGGRPQVIVVKVDTAEIPPLYPPSFYPPGRE
ncbi:MAG TPA: thiamine pyrophosphate-binding protein [Gemmatimonadales bacterium]|nr:thiamine pyrophosphate-binding protein [Gemmatimonadales bacterium]